MPVICTSSSCALQPHRVNRISWRLTCTCCSFSCNLNGRWHVTQVLLSVNVSPNATDYDETASVLKVPRWRGLLPSDVGCSLSPDVDPLVSIVKWDETKSIPGTYAPQNEVQVS